jgi:hypothetical protein
MMRAYPIRSRLVPLGLGLLLFFGEQPILFTQQFGEDQVKAAYLYNFAKFAEWPSTAFTNASDPIRLCILNDQSFELQLTQIVKGKTISGRPVVAVPIQNPEQARNCHILFIDFAQSGELPQILKELRGSSVLTVGEGDEFSERGGAIGFLLQNGQVHFQVNNRAATQSGIRLSSRLLGVATKVLE